jgi:ribonuclease HII
MSSKMNPSFLIGIDEAGRGPLAGPVAVGAFAVRFKNAKNLLKMFKGARDSKKMTGAAREAVFLEIKKAEKAGLVYFAVSYSSAKMIDEKGIVPAIKSALNRSLKKIENFSLRSDLSTQVGPELNDCQVLLDGSLKAPLRYVNQKTIIGGDNIEPVISLASICAKVLRDRKMKRLAKKYPHYGFEVHKGYGTKTHYKAIKKHGFSKEHRKSFLKGITGR